MLESMLEGDKDRTPLPKDTGKHSTTQAAAAALRRYSQNSSLPPQVSSLLSSLQGAEARDGNPMAALSGMVRGEGTEEYVTHFHDEEMVAFSFLLIGWVTKRRISFSFHADRVFLLPFRCCSRS
jgi:hypothetical protein